MSYTDVAWSLGASFILVMFLMFAISLTFYILGAVGLSTMAKNRGMDHAWFAWLPFFNLYLIGELIGDEVWGTKGAKWILSLFPVINAFISFTGILALVGLILDIVYLAYWISALYKLFRIYAPNTAILYTIFFVFSGLWFFVLRNNAPVGLRFYNKNVYQNRVPPRNYQERPVRRVEPERVREAMMHPDSRVFNSEDGFDRPDEREFRPYNPADEEATEPLLGKEE